MSRVRGRVLDVRGQGLWMSGLLGPDCEGSGVLVWGPGCQGFWLGVLYVRGLGSCLSGVGVVCQGSWALDARGRGS